MDEGLIEGESPNFQISLGVAKWEYNMISVVSDIRYQISVLTWREDFTLLLYYIYNK